MSDQIAVLNDLGVVLTVGVNSNFDRQAIVMPIGYTGDSLGPVSLCFQCVSDFIAGPLPTFLACLSEDAFVSFISAEGMIDGQIPWRVDFGPTDKLGSRPSTPLSSNVTGLLIFYEDPRDNPTHLRIRVGKTFMPGVPSVDIVGDNVGSDLFDAYQTFALVMQEGYPALAEEGKLWQRMLVAPKPRVAGTEIKRVVTPVVRAKVYTQRRRMTPRS